MTVVYIDSVFVLNAVMDYLLCLVTARLAGIRLRRGRYFLSALAGGIYAAAVFLPGCSFLAETPIKIAAGILLALIAYGGEEAFFRLALLLFAISCAMAGCVLALGLLTGAAVPMASGVFYTDVDTKVLLIAAGAAYLVLTVVFRGLARHGISGELLTVRVCIGGKITILTTLRDTGNSLRDPVNGVPVLVTALGALDGLLPSRVRRLLTSEGLASPAELVAPLMEAAPDLRPRLTPYRVVGTAGGLLLTIRTDWVEIGGVRENGVRAALSPTTLGTGYAALWGGEVREGGRYGHIQTTFPTSAGTAGDGLAHPLHRRQRHVAAAADPRAGGGASGVHRGGGRPTGIN